jgi:hypothetical protein
MGGKTNLRTLQWVLVCLFIVAAEAHAQEAAPTPKQASAQLNEQLPHWLRLSGEYRVRFEATGGSGFKTDNDDAYMLGRGRVTTTLIPTPWLKLQFQGQDAEVWGRNGKPDGPPYEDSFDVRQAYVEAGNVESSRLGLRVGRQELSFGEMRLVGHLNWTNTARSFDAVRASYRTRTYRIDAFAASVVNLRDGAFNRRTDGNNLHGIYSSFSNIVPKATVEPYVFWRLSRGVKNESGNVGKLDFKTIGIRWVGKLPSNLDYGLEFAGQTGSLSSDAVRAVAGHWVLGYSLPKLKTTPRAFAEYNYASGDRNPNDGRRGTFDQLYPTGHDKLGLADQVGWRNIEHARAGVELKPSKKLNLAAGYHCWWLANAHDGLYNAAGALVARSSNAGAGRFVGQEADVQGTYPLKLQVQLGFGYSHIFPGTFLKNTTPGKSHNFSYVMLTYLFQ